MKKSTKGAFAAGAAAVLLLGGAGSLAYWSQGATVNAGSFKTGTLGLTAGTCDANWTYASGSDAGNAATLIVPGDVIQKKCTYTITATGDHLTAALTTPSTVAFTPAATGSNKMTVAATYQLAGNPVTEVTSANNGQTVTATIAVTFPFGDATATDINDTQGLTESLNDLTVTLTQDQSSGKNPAA